MQTDKTPDILTQMVDQIEQTLMNSHRVTASFVQVAVLRTIPLLIQNAVRMLLLKVPLLWKKLMHPPLN